MNKRYPTVDQPLNYEHVLFNHLECMSFFVAQGNADLKQMIEIFEQLTYTQIDHQTRKYLRFMKRVFNELRDVVKAHYSTLRDEIQIKSEKPEEVLRELQEEEEEVANNLEEIYYKLLLRFLICNTPNIQSHNYSIEEIKEDLKDEITSILPFDSEVFEMIIKEVEADVFGNRTKGKLSEGAERIADVCGNTTQQTVEAE